MSLDNYIVANKKRIDASLVSYFARTKGIYANDRITKTVFSDIEKYTMSGGKRLRPLLMSMSFQMYGGRGQQIVAQSSIVLELLHSFMLIHDDIEDSDFVRHGEPTIEARFRKRLDKLPEKQRDHVALSAAINAGDIAHALVYEQISNLKVDSATAMRLVNLVSTKSTITAIGQQYDILASVEDHITKTTLEKIASYKTAYYSFILPLQFGHILAKKYDQLEKLERLGYLLGTGFQLSDDILGVYGDSKKLGKPNISDMQEGKKTFLVYFALKNANLKQEQILQKYWGNTEASFADLQKIRQLFDDTGAKRQVQALADNMYQKTLYEIQELEVSAQYEALLQEFASRCVRRDH